MHTPRRSLLNALTLAAAIVTAPAAHALNIQFDDITPGGMAPEQLAAFNAAAAIWQNRLADPVTVYVTINFQSYGNNGSLGSTDSTATSQSYAAVRSALAADRTSSLDNSAVSHLQPGNSLTFLASNLDGTTRLDNDTNACPAGGPSVPCATNNQTLSFSTANAKALGFATSTSAANPDARIAFNGSYANQFDFNRADGIDAGQYDFVSIATHEIGHALGFISGVDDIDFCSPLLAGRCSGIQGLDLDNAYGFEKYAVYTVLDLYRYSASGVLDERVSGRPYFSVDGGDTSIEGFSNGSYNGSDRYQASHFIPGPGNVMNPFGFKGAAVDPSAADLAAMDAIGWDLVTAVPEPAAWALMLAGGAAVAATSRRRRRA